MHVFRTKYHKTLKWIFIVQCRYLTGKVLSIYLAQMKITCQSEYVSLFMFYLLIVLKIVVYNEVVKQLMQSIFGGIDLFFLIERFLEFIKNTADGTILFGLFALSRPIVANFLYINCTKLGMFSKCMLT